MIVADACAYAWLALVRRSDVTLARRGFCWLALVAQEAWLLSAGRPECPAGTFLTDPDHAEELPAPAGLADDPVDRVIAIETHRELIERFAALKPRERRDLFLHAGAYRYRPTTITSRESVANGAPSRSPWHFTSPMSRITRVPQV